MVKAVVTTESTEIQAYVPSLNLLILTHPEAVQDTIEANMEGMMPEFPRIKFPSGGLLAFEVPGEAESDIARELVGVVVDHHAVNAFWNKKYDGDKNPPDCSSMDAKIGFAPEGAAVPWAGSHNDCMSCPFNQFGTGKDDQGNATNGKACKNMWRVALLPEGEMFPQIVTVPPTSIKAWKTYVVSMTSKMKKLVGIVTSIKLKKEKSSGGIEYSSGIFGRLKDLQPQETSQLIGYAASMKPLIRNLVVDTTDYSTEASATTEEESIA